MIRRNKVGNDGDWSDTSNYNSNENIYSFKQKFNFATNAPGPGTSDAYGIQGTAQEEKRKE